MPYDVTLPDIRRLTHSLLKTTLAVFRGDVLHIDLANLGWSRAHVEMLFELVERALVALCLTRDRALVRVLDKARDVELVGLVRCPRTDEVERVSKYAFEQEWHGALPEVHALDNALDCVGDLKEILTIAWLSSGVRILAYSLRHCDGRGRECSHRSFAML